MAGIFKKRLTKENSLFQIMQGIGKVARDNSRHFLIDDEAEWFEIKMREIKRLSRLGVVKINKLFAPPS